MIKRGRHLIKSHMTLEYDFSGIRLQDGSLTPVDWQLRVDLVATGKKGKAKEETEYEAGITYQKVYFWLDTNLPNIITVDVSNPDDLYIANLTSNIMMFCPGNTGDELLIQLLHSKISALASPDLLVGEIHLKGSDSTLHYTFDCTNGDYALPINTKEYYTEGVAKDAQPWWLRSDGFCFEFIRPEGNVLPDEELFGNIVDPMVEFNNIMAEVNETHIGLVREPAKIVHVDKWIPKKIE